MLQQNNPDDYIVATGEVHTVKDFIEAAFHVAGINDWQKYVRQDKKYFRPAEVNYLCGDVSKAKKILKFEHTIDFYALVKMMVQNDIQLLSNINNN